jgi:hypothetical protein
MSADHKETVIYTLPFRVTRALRLGVALERRRLGEILERELEEYIQRIETWAKEVKADAASTHLQP